MYPLIIMLLSAVLAGLSVISLVKNFLVNFNVSDSGWKTILIAALAVICLLCAVISYSEAYTIRDILVMQSSPELKQEEIDQLKNLIPLKTVIVNVSICIGYISYLLHMLLIRNVKAKKMREMESNTGRRWMLKQ